MTASFTDQRSSCPSQPARSLPLKSSIVSDLPSRGATTGGFLSFSSPRDAEQVKPRTKDKTRLSRIREDIMVSLRRGYLTSPKGQRGNHDFLAGASASFGRRGRQFNRLSRAAAIIKLLF